MKIAILGGGITGLTAGYYLSQKYNVTLYEKEDVLGGMAAGFRGAGWNWFLERTYHHIFTNDSDILSFAKEIGFEGFFFSSPKTVSLYGEEYNYRTFPVDTPQDFLRLPLLGFPEKIRAGFVLAFLKLSPFFSFYEGQTAKDFLIKTMGEGVWKMFWEEMFRKKYGKYAENIVASFIWARIKKRTPSLGYVEGGFQTFVDFLEKINKSRGVIIKKQTGVKNIIRKNEGYVLQIGEQERKEEFDIVISTLPTPILKIAGQNIFSSQYLDKLSRIKYLHAVNLILESKTPLFKKEYWVNVCDREAPMMAMVQHTNFIDKKHYGNHHLLYIANYIEEKDRLFSESEEWVTKHYMFYIKKLFPAFDFYKNYLFRTRFAQPIFDKEFPKNMPRFETPAKNFFVANLDMTYPYDRGTNYAVKLGREVAGLLI